MNPYRMAQPPRWWAPSLKPRFVRLLRSYRSWHRLHDQRLLDVNIAGAEHLEQALQEGCGVLITPNHSTHADSDTMYAVADKIRCLFYFMATWHVFDSRTVIGQKFLQYHGVFSVDREGVDVQAFKQAVKILADEPEPLVIFPEGEVYHCNDRVTPFREGAAAIAVSAAKRASRRIVCIPCALKYRYLMDPTPDLTKVMEQLERSMFWRPRPELELGERIYRFAKAILAVKEIEFLGEASSGSLPERTDALACAILQKLEERHEVSAPGDFIPERVKELRRRILSALGDVEAGSNEEQELREHLDDVFLVVQLFSYPGDYVEEQPSIERLAETLDKFEEDVLGQYSAPVRATRKVNVSMGPPVPVDTEKGRKTAVHELSECLEAEVQRLLDAQLESG